MGKREELVQKLLEKQQRRIANIPRQNKIFFWIITVITIFALLCAIIYKSIPFVGIAFVGWLLYFGNKAMNEKYKKHVAKLHQMYKKPQ